MPPWLCYSIRESLTLRQKHPVLLFPWSAPFTDFDLRNSVNLLYTKLVLSSQNCGTCTSAVSFLHLVRSTEYFLVPCAPLFAFLFLSLPLGLWFRCPKIIVDCRLVSMAGVTRKKRHATYSYFFSLCLVIVDKNSLFRGLIKKQGIYHVHVHAKTLRATVLRLKHFRFSFRLEKYTAFLFQNKTMSSNNLS